MDQTTELTRASGSIAGKCKYCSLEIAISPASQRKMKEVPSTCAVCLDCGTKKISREVLEKNMGDGKDVKIGIMKESLQEFREWKQNFKNRN